MIWIGWDRLIQVVPSRSVKTPVPGEPPAISSVSAATCTTKRHKMITNFIFDLFVSCANEERSFSICWGKTERLFNIHRQPVYILTQPYISCLITDINWSIVTAYIYRLTQAGVSKDNCIFNTSVYFYWWLKYCCLTSLWWRDVLGSESGNGCVEGSHCSQR